ncbi:SusE domain-containing protein [Hymenobacter endophyticus]|uniref:SusE domain-containing protein n=1 Tax=Hymenobacter endophyticus TaxID=3076335 RepID=A0ABU3TJI6_9BACT|nr:SusE domain-containing protein [Hymenobacter endophyticus]MDU0371537.1 SusE domain-containing protein [Hymenobacter endophyticus]
MKTWITRTFAGAFALATVALASCEKDEDKVVINSNAATALTASTTTANITTSNSSSQAVTYNWSKVDFGYNAAVVYTLQFAKRGTDFASTQDFNVGSSLSKSFTNKELNDLYNAIDCSLPATPAAFPLEVRVKATVGDAVTPVYSAAQSLVASPYPDFVAPTDRWGLVGPAGDGWPGATATDRNMPYDCRVRGYVARMTLNAGPFKFRRNQDWGTNLGGTTGDYTKGVTLTPGGSDLTITTPGTYTVKLEVTTDAAGATTGGKVTITP